jgi:branched-chain amino acid transport system permease protein
MQRYWTTDVRNLGLPTSGWRYVNGWLNIDWTQGIANILPFLIAIGTVLLLNRTKVGTAMRALADNRDNTALLGIPVRKVESVAWFGSGILFGVSGLLLAQLVSMEIAALTFTFPVAALAAALIARVESLWTTVAAAFVIGIVQSSLNAINSLSLYRNTTPFVSAIVVLLWFGWRGQTQRRIA